MSANRRVLFAPACGPGVGGGHVLRDIALAQALRARGAACTFALSDFGAALLARFGQGCATRHPLPHDGGPKALADAVAATRPDVLVLDDYALDGRAVEGLGPGRPRVVVIDDLADRRHLCELLVDPGYGRASGDYDGLVPAGCERLVGPAYALLRPGFSDARGPTPQPHTVRRTFVSFGLSDVEGVTARAVARLRAASPSLFIDVALAGDAASLPDLVARAAQDGRLALHPDATDMAELMRAADVAVGAGGASTWERCALGLPTLAVIVADNQRPMVRALDADGVLLACDLQAPGFEGEFDAAWTRLEVQDTRTTLSSRALALCDGRGAARVADAVLAL